MDGGALQSLRRCLQKFPKLPLWIAEFVWTRGMMEIQDVVDSLTWLEMDSQPLSLDDPCRLRAASAQVYSIVKNRDVQRFEKVMGFLDATYGLLPRLVAPIKHMKIMFGLKTMAVMQMLREDRGMVDTMFKINQLFPSKLPQYQGQCNQHEIFLMRKNHLDFKALAQSLVMDKNKLEDYVVSQMEEQYGEHYAQKVEDRLLHYLHELQTVLPGETHIDQILRKESLMTEEEKLLMEVITSDSTTIATTLKKLLHCDAASCSPGRVSEQGQSRKESPQLSNYVLRGSSSKVPHKSAEATTLLEFQPEVWRGEEEADQDVSKDSPLLLESDDDDVRRRQQTEEDREVVRSGEREAASSPQFCSKHRRWVKSILQQCPDECSEELLLQANASLSPPLFQSSSSVTSSQDLTPSGLVPRPPDQQTPTQAQAHEEAEDKLSSGLSGSENDACLKEPVPQLSSSRDTPLPAWLSPAVRLVDMASVRGICSPFKPQQASPNHFATLSNKQAASTFSSQVLTSSQRHTSGDNAVPQGMATDQPEPVASKNPLNTMHQVQTASTPQDATSSTGCQPPTRQSLSRLSRKFRRTCAPIRQPRVQNPSVEQFTTFQTRCPPLPQDDIISGPPARHASTSDAQPGALSSVCTAEIPLFTKSSRQVVPQSSIRPHPETHSITPFQSETLPHTVASSTSNSNCTTVRSETSRIQRAHIKLSLPSQALLLQSKLLQPFVSLTRLSPQDCHQMTRRRSSTRNVEPVGSSNDNKDRRKEEEEEEEEDADSSFDLNILYSSYSSADSKDSIHCDPDYKPRIKQKRLLSEYESALTPIRT